MPGYGSAVITAAITFASVIAFQGSPAFAAAHLTFVSATGSDARPCTLELQPCRTLQRAQSQTIPGGEVRLLSSLPTGGTATINRSITVEGGGHTILGTILIDNSNAMVTLRNLSLNGRTVAEYGVRIEDAAAVHIENVTVERYTFGIYLADGVSTELFVNDSVSRDNDHSGLYVDGPPTSATTSVENSRFNNNFSRGVIVFGGNTSISNSVASGNGVGVYAAGGASNVTGTVAADNISFGFSVTAGQLTLQSSVARGNGVAGLFVWPASSARISNSVFTQNGEGVHNVGTLETLGNNLFFGNSDTDVSGTLTPLTAQ
jgi:hypothetical protein